MTRVVSLYLASWPVDRLRRGLGSAAPPPDAPLALVGTDGRRRVVHATNAAGRALGLRPGMAAAQAHALVPGLLAHEAAPAEDAAGLERLAAWALKRYAPVVAPDPPDGLVLDVTGAAHLHGGEAAMLADMVRASGRTPSPRGSRRRQPGALRTRSPVGAATAVVEGADLAEVLGPLPVAALRLAPDLVDGLRRLGLDTVGELAAQPRAPLALRFGPEPGRRLDQALGRLADRRRASALLIGKAHSHPTYTLAMASRSL